jgi:hypothetical protein
MTERLVYSKQNMMPIVTISDYDWWVNNQSILEEWISKNLPRGIDHVKGTVIEFDTDRDATAFMIRWGRD